MAGPEGEGRDEEAAAPAAAAGGPASLPSRHVRADADGPWAGGGAICRFERTFDRITRERLRTVRAPAALRRRITRLLRQAHGSTMDETFWG